MNGYGFCKPGVDYTLNGVIPSQKTKQRFAYDDLVEIEMSISAGHTVQRCKFCDRGWPELPHLLKYAVRHYVCEDCAEHFAQTAAPRSEPPSKFVRKWFGIGGDSR